MPEAYRAPGLTDWFGEVGAAQEVKRKSVRGIGVNLLASVTNQGLGAASLIILARLLTPADFGLIAMTGALVGIAGVLQSMGLSAATLRFRAITHQQVSNLFWMNFASSAAMALAIIACAPLAHRFYGDPRVGPIMHWMALNFMLNGLSTQHLALLRRSMHFTRTARVSALGVAISAAVSIAGATLGYGYWALVWGSTAGALTGAVLVWHFCDWRPGLPRRGAGTRPLLTFGLHLMAFGILGYVARNVQSLIVGRGWGAAEAGIYARAHNVRMRLTGGMVDSLSLVAPAGLSRLAGDTAAYCAYYYKGATVAVIATLPIAFVAAVLPHELILTLFGPQWERSAQLLQWLSIGIVPQIVSTTTGWVYLSAGRASAMMWWGIWGWSTMILGTLLGALGGLEGIAMASSATAVLLVVPALWFAFRGTPLRLAPLGRALMPPLASGSLASAGAWILLSGMAGSAPLPRLLAGGGTFLALYLVLLIAFGQRKLIWDILKQFGARRLG